MTTGSESKLHAIMSEINRAWRENNPSGMRPYLHPQIAMVFPGFSGTATGADTMIAGFEEWCSNARVVEYDESDEQIQIVDNVGVVSFRFDMLYERAAYSERSTGRDIWAFELIDGKWLAVWRAMADLKEERTSRELTV